MDTSLIGTTVADPWMYFCVVLAGILVGGARALIKGDLRTGREVDQNNARLEYLEQALRARDTQVSDALEVLPKIAGVLAELHPSEAVDRT